MTSKLITQQRLQQPKAHAQLHKLPWAFFFTIFFTNFAINNTNKSI